MTAKDENYYTVAEYLDKCGIVDISQEDADTIKKDARDYSNVHMIEVRERKGPGSRQGLPFLRFKGKALREVCRINSYRMESLKRMK